MAAIKHEDQFSLVIPRTAGEILADMVSLARELSNVEGCTVREAVEALDQYIGADASLNSGPLRWAQVEA